MSKSEIEANSYTVDHNAKHSDASTFQAGLEVDSRPQYFEYHSMTNAPMGAHDPNSPPYWTASTDRMSPRYPITPDDYPTTPNDSTIGSNSRTTTTSIIPSGSGATLASKEPFHGQEKRRVLGLSIGFFWGIVVACALIVSGGVGGGVGAGLAAKKECERRDNRQAQTVTMTISSISDSSSTASSTIKATGLPSPAPVSGCQTNPSFDSSAIVASGPDGKPYIGAGGAQKFQVFCNTDWPAGSLYGNPQLHDIMMIYAPDLESCVAACASYNIGYQKNSKDGVSVGGGMCKAVALVQVAGEGCYLKNGTGTNNTGTSYGARIDSALLLE